LSRVHRDILIFAFSALKTWVLHVNTFYSQILYISPVAAVNRSILSVYHSFISALLRYACLTSHGSSKSNKKLSDGRGISDYTYPSKWDLESPEISSDLKKVSLLKSSDKILPGPWLPLTDLYFPYITHLFQLY
jgi:hypothetical protein